MNETKEKGIRNNRKPNAKESEFTGLVIFLSQRHKNGRLIPGAIEEAMDHFPFKRSSIQRIWKEARSSVLDPSVSVIVGSKKKGRSGRKRKYKHKDLVEMKAIPFSLLSCILN